MATALGVDQHLAVCSDFPQVFFWLVSEQAFLLVVVVFETRFLSVAVEPV